MCQKGWSVFYQTFCSRYWGKQVFLWIFLKLCVLAQKASRPVLSNISLQCISRYVCVRLVLLMWGNCSLSPDSQVMMQQYLTDPQWWIWDFSLVSNATVVYFSQGVPPCCVPSGLGSYLNSMVLSKVGQKSKPSACISLQVHKERQKKLPRKMHRLKATTAKKIIFKQQGWSKLRC